MLKYLIILLDDASVSFCHYGVRKQPRLMDAETLRKGILFGMKENLTIQFVYPRRELPQELQDLVETIDHTKIMPAEKCGGADVVVYDSWGQLESAAIADKSVCVVRCAKAELLGGGHGVEGILRKAARLNVVITDVDAFTEADFDAYKGVLDKWADTLKTLFLEGLSPQLNVLTDRMMLDKMNNCGAGYESVTLAPDGRFYVCPAFYEEDAFSVGDLGGSPDIKNRQLYRLDHAPICRHCDAYQCRRCVWLNRKMTLEVNTPSHEQCVVAHVEREASRRLLASIRKHGEFLPQQEIKEIDYNDPFETAKRW